MNYTIVSATNRAASNSLVVANCYQNLLSKQGIDAKIVDLQQLPTDFIFSALYENAQLNDEFNALQKTIDQSDKLIFVVAEYNGSFPGVLKAFIDGLRYPDSFKNKKAALVGLSSGSQGSALALSHLTDILNYCGMHVLAQKPRLQFIDQYIDDEKLVSKAYHKLLLEQIEALKSF